MPEQKNETKSNVKLWILLSLCFLILIGCVIVFVNSRKGEAVRQRDVTWTDVGFDTPVTFSATCSEEDFEKYSQIAKETFETDNALFDQYNSYDGINNVKTLNETAAKTPVEVDPDITTILEESANFTRLNPKFDVTEGKVLSLWHEAREAETPYLPDEAEIEKAKVHTGIEGVEISGNTVSFSDDSVQLDLGAIAKGWTAGKAAEKLHEAGLDNGFINAGGNVVLLGEKPDGNPWVIGIQSPDESNSVVQLVTETPVCMVTSGDYQRYMEVDGKTYSHIVDPDTGWPVSYMRSVTVIGPDSGTCDAESTTLFLMPLEESMEYAKANRIEAVWIVDKGTSKAKADYTTDKYDIYITDGIKDSIQLTEA